MPSIEDRNPTKKVILDPNKTPTANETSAKRVTFDFGNGHKQTLVITPSDLYIHAQLGFALAMHKRWQLHRFLFTNERGHTHPWRYAAFAPDSTVRVTAVPTTLSATEQAEGIDPPPHAALRVYRPRRPGRHRPLIPQRHFDGSLLLEEDRGPLTLSRQAVRQFQGRVAVLRRELARRDAVGAGDELDERGRRREREARARGPAWLDGFDDADDIICAHWRLDETGWLPRDMWPRLVLTPKGKGRRDGEVAATVDGGVLEPEDWSEELVVRLACYAMATSRNWRKAVWRLRAVWQAREQREQGSQRTVVSQGLLPADVEEALRSLAYEGEYEDEGAVHLPPPDKRLPRRTLTDEEVADALLRMAVWSG